MRSLKEDELYGFYRTSAEYLALTSRPNRLHSEIHFGIYCRGGGCRGEMAMRWHLLGGCLAPHLEVFDDAWAVLADLPELIDWLRCNNNGKATAEEFSAFLKTIGFEDTTTRYPLNLVAALDGLMAHDVGATDSGIRDEALRKRVKAHLDGMPDGEMMAALSRYAREHFLAESALANGRSIADVAEFVRWLSDRMDIDV